MQRQEIGDDTNLIADFKRVSSPTSWLGAGHGFLSDKTNN